MEPTIFERIISREIPAHIVYEDENSIAILDIMPKALGHTLVIPKTVSRTFLEMDAATVASYGLALQKVAKAVKEGLGSDGCNIIANVEKAANQEVFHTHMHVIPRWHGDGTDLNPGTHASYENEEQMARYAEKIRNALS